MPPTISAIDEMTISAKNVPWLIWSHSCRNASCVMMSKSFGSSSLQPVADAHDALDVGDRVRLARRRRAARTEIWTFDDGARGAADANVADAQAEDALVGRVRDDDEVVLAEVEAAGGRPLVEHADDLEALGADAHHLADRVDAGRREQQLVRRVAEDDDVPAVLHLGAVEEPAGEDRDARAVGEVLGGAEHDERLRLLVAVEDALLGRRARAGAELDVDELERRGLLLERARVGDRQVRPLQQLR